MLCASASSFTHDDTHLKPAPTLAAASKVTHVDCPSFTQLPTVDTHSRQSITSHDKFPIATLPPDSNISFCSPKPKRAGSASVARFDRDRKATTALEARRLRAVNSDLRWNQQRGLCEIKASHPRGPFDFLMYRTRNSGAIIQQKANGLTKILHLAAHKLLCREFLQPLSL